MLSFSDVFLIMELNTMAFSSYMERNKSEQSQKPIETDCGLSFPPTRTEWCHWPANWVTKT